jgi:D-glycero-D-manno-heptose 1,7-bisphosphate phosphatase
MARLIILDRDGVINFDSPEFVKTPDEWRPIPGSLDAIADLKRAGWQVAVCSNQSGVGRGLIRPEDLDAIHECLHAALAERETALDALSFCPHRPEEHCSCRKPLPGLFLETMERLGAHPEQTVVIGDSQRDLQAGKSAGCRCILVRTGNGRQAEEAARAMGDVAIFDDLRAAADHLLRVSR